ncbi:Serine/threonine-protein kinase Sgk1 [Dissostichus eleginoides]|uniref:non-specific serine/threonine protein kinase n=1 Tax=Dissostichus eleginoides TaxID=100907 RepID=A0AAD9C6B5_DISEL|nr:Serine/threonine-protein kinase Sgk1 [Dissostichus eleginoides]
MRGLVSFFSALLKGKKVGFSDFVHKCVSSQQFCQQMKPSDFDYLKVIGKGSFGKVLLARHRKDGGYYAVKVLQKQMIVKRNEVIHQSVHLSVHLSVCPSMYLLFLLCVCSRGM